MIQSTYILYPTRQATQPEWPHNKTTSGRKSKRIATPRILPLYRELLQKFNAAGCMRADQMEQKWTWKRQQSWFHEARQHAAAPRVPPVEKRGHRVWPYEMLLPRIRVICLDKVEPIAIKSYPGAEWK